MMQAVMPYDPETIDARLFWRQIRRRLGLVSACTLVSLAIGGFYVMKTPPVYRATTKLLIEQEGAKVEPFRDVVMVSGHSDAHYQTQYRILQSRSLARRVIDTLHLRTHPDFAPREAAGKRGIRPLLAWSEAWLQQLKQLRWPALAAEEAGTPQAVGASHDSPVKPATDTELADRFLAQLKVRSSSEHHLVDVSFEARDPVLAASVANTLSQLYIDFSTELRFQALQEALDWLQKQAGDIRQQVEASERALQQYKDTHDAYLIDDRLPGLMQEITELDTLLARARAERAELETLYTRRPPVKGETADWIPAVLENTLLQGLKTRYADLQQTLSESGQRFDAKHPHIVGLQGQLSTLQAKIDREIEKIILAMEVKHRAAKAREEALAARVEALKGEVKTLNEKSVQYGMLKRDAESNRRLSELLLNRLKETSASRGLSSGNNIYVVDQAEVPIKPVNLPPVVVLAASGMAGLLLSLVAVLFVGRFDTTIKTPEEAEKLLGLPVFGAIKQYKRSIKRLGSHLPVAITMPASPVTESFKALRANLLFNPTDPTHKVFLVSSPHPHDGKTTVAVNLAVVLAQMDKRVLLIDADLRHPSIQSHFPAENRLNLSELLVTERYDKALAAASKGLFVVHAGTPPANPSELLGSQSMQRFLKFVRRFYDIIIIDSPPILSVSDAVGLRPFVDAILMVLRADATPYEQARRAIAPFLATSPERPFHNGQDSIGQQTHTNLGLVINFLDPREDTYYYGNGSR